MKKKDYIINKWQETVSDLETLITKSSPDNDMLCIMIARKNQLIECISDLKKLSNENSIPPNTCRKKILTKEQADKIICRDELAALNLGRKIEHQRVAYYCDMCKAWHTSTITKIHPMFK